jgi:hypothetical protein
MKHNILLFIILLSSCSLFAQNSYKDNSVLASGKWIKVSAAKEGIHKITYNQLQSWGVSSPENVAVFGNGGYMLPEWNNIYYPDDLQKINVMHGVDKDGRNAIFFYSTGSVKWEYNLNRSIFTASQNLYSNNKTYFYITSDLPKSVSPNNKPKPAGEPGISLNYYDELLLYKQDLINIHNSGNVWYSDRITRNSSKTVTFNAPNVLTNHGGVLTVSGGAASSQRSYFHYEMNGANIATQTLPQRNLDDVMPITTDFEFYPLSNMNIKVTYETEASSGESWLKYLTLNIKSRLKLDNSQLTFRNSVARNHEAVSFSIETSADNLKVWDITDYMLPQNIEFTKAGGNISFTDSGNEIRCYVVFDPRGTAIADAQFEANLKNQNIHGLPNYEMIILSHPDFLPASEKLAEFHRQYEKLKVLVINVSDVYNEFSSGIADVTAIRNMMRMFYNRGKDTSTPLKYLLLMGDGSYDNRNRIADKTNFIPTYQSGFLSSFHTFMSDDYFGLLGDDEGMLTGDLVIGIGRIPCRTLDEADIVVNKTINYTKPETMGDWRNVIALLADDEDGNRYMDESETITQIVNDNFPGFYFDKIYFDAYRQISTSIGDFYPDATIAIKNRVEKGALILNYNGHANAISMAHEKVLEISDINSWGNKDQLPIFVTATCEYGRFDDDKMSAGETILFHPAGGGVSLFTTTRLVYAGDNVRLSKNFYKHVFQQDKNGNNLRMGDIMRLAKNSTNDNLNKRSFSLLGDPALRLAFPKYKVVTNTINGHQAGDTLTLSALEKVTITGEVLCNENKKLENLTGKVIATIYDKEVTAQTLANDGGKKFDFQVQDNIIYKGISTVNNGQFSMSFIVPKDISYNLGKGRIIYYFSNDTIDGNGSTDQFMIGGSGSNPVVDNTPPKIDLYLNNYNFKPNDKVSSSALLLVNLFDESGINTVGTGIGHDITAVLNDDHSNVIVLNDFYTADLDTYKSGKVLFPLNKLNQGYNKIMVKAWDVHNNSAYSEIEFYVEEGFEIVSIHNSPNPVDFSTTFYISHNLPGDIFNVNLEVFNLRGLRVHQSSETISSSGSTEAQLRWDVSNRRHLSTNDRLLIYRVTMQNPSGLSATGAGKLLLNNF